MPSDAQARAGHGLGHGFKTQGTYRVAERFLAAPVLDLDKACAIIRRSAGIIQSVRNETLAGTPVDAW